MNLKNNNKGAKMKYLILSLMVFTSFQAFPDPKSTSPKEGHKKMNDIHKKMNDIQRSMATMNKELNRQKDIWERYKREIKTIYDNGNSNSGYAAFPKFFEDYLSSVTKVLDEDASSQHSTQKRRN